MAQASISNLLFKIIDLKKKLVESYILLKEENTIKNCEDTVSIAKTLQIQLKKIKKKPSITAAQKSSFESLSTQTKSLVNKCKQIKSFLQNSSLEGFVIEDIESAFKGRIKTAVVTNFMYKDPILFFEEIKDAVIEYIKNAIDKHKMIKVGCIFSAFFTKILTKKEVEKFFHNSYEVLSSGSDISEWYEEKVKNKIPVLICDFEKNTESGFLLSEIINLLIKVVKYMPLHAGSYIRLPQFIFNKKCVINVQNTDNKCFAYAVCSQLNRKSNNPQRVSHYKNYNQYMNINEADFPMTLEKIRKFEKENTNFIRPDGTVSQISVNVYALEEKENDQKNPRIVPVYLTKEDRKDHVDLLLLTDDNGNTHFSNITDLSALVGSQLSKNGHKKYICKRCLRYWPSQKKLDKHKIDCNVMNHCRIDLPPKGTKLKFKKIDKQLPLNYIIYADIECLLGKVKSCNAIKGAFQQHQPFAIGYYLHSRNDETKCKYSVHRGQNCIKDFATNLNNIATEINTVSFFTHF